jgi:hypothetical protein
MRGPRRSGRVVVAVLVLEPGLVHMRVEMRHAVMVVLVGVLDVLMVVVRVRVGVRHAPVRVLVRVGVVVRVRLRRHAGSSVGLPSRRRLPPLEAADAPQTSRNCR